MFRFSLGISVSLSESDSGAMWLITDLSEWLTGGGWRRKLANGIHSNSFISDMLRGVVLPWGVSHSFLTRLVHSCLRKPSLNREVGWSRQKTQLTKNHGAEITTPFSMKLKCLCLGWNSYRQMRTNWGWRRWAVQYNVKYQCTVQCAKSWMTIPVENEWSLICRFEEIQFIFPPIIITKQDCQTKK